MFNFLKKRPFPKLKFLKRLPNKLRSRKSGSSAAAATASAYYKDRDGDTGQFVIEELDDEVTHYPVTQRDDTDGAEKGQVVSTAGTESPALEGAGRGHTGTPILRKDSPKATLAGAAEGLSQPRSPRTSPTDAPTSPVLGTENSYRVSEAGTVGSCRESEVGGTGSYRASEVGMAGSYRVSEGGTAPGSYRVSEAGTTPGSYRVSDAEGSSRVEVGELDSSDEEEFSTADHVRLHSDPDSPTPEKVPPKMSRTTSVRNSFKRFRRKSLSQIDNLRESIRRKSSKTTKGVSLIATEVQSSSTESVHADPITFPKGKVKQSKPPASPATTAETSKAGGGSRATADEVEDEDEDIIQLDGSPTPFRRQFSDRMRRSLKKSGKYLKYSMEGFSAVATANGLSNITGGTAQLVK